MSQPMLSHQAVFEMTLTFPKDLQALSNMDSIAERGGGEWRTSIEWITHSLSLALLLSFLLNFNHILSYNSLTSLFLFWIFIQWKTMDWRHSTLLLPPLCPPTWLPLRLVSIEVNSHSLLVSSRPSLYFCLSLLCHCSLLAPSCCSWMTTLRRIWLCGRPNERRCPSESLYTTG